MKKSLAQCLQSESVLRLKKARNDRLFDLQDYEETDPRVKPEPKPKPSPLKSDKETIYSQIQKVTRVMRNLEPSELYERDQNGAAMIEGMEEQLLADPHPTPQPSSDSESDF